MDELKDQDIEGEEIDSNNVEISDDRNNASASQQQISNPKPAIICEAQKPQTPPEIMPVPKPKQFAQALVVRPKCTNSLCQSSQGMKVIKLDNQSYQYLCEQCHKRFKQDHYCKYCKQIYFAEEDGDCWIECDNCGNWTHASCEQKHGPYKNIRRMMQESEEFPYKCPKCRPLKQKKLLVVPGMPAVKQKPRPKRVDVYLNSLGFYWRLKPEEIQYDIQWAKSL